MRNLRISKLSALLLIAAVWTHLLAGCGDFWKPPSVSTTTGTSSTTVLVASSTSVVVGSSVTLTATVSPIAAAGTVTFFNGSNSLGTAALVSGAATLTTSFSSMGTQSLTASFGGDANYGASTSSAVVVTVTGSAAATVVLTPSISAPRLGAALTLTATVSPAASSGTVMFFNGSKSLGSSTLRAGTAGRTAQIFVPGEQTLTAIYSGNSTYAASASNGVAINVGPAGSTPIMLSLSIARSSSSTDSGASFIATVSSSDATGEITFYDGDVSMGSKLLNSGSAVLNMPMLSPGMHTITAVYSGDSIYSSSTSAEKPFFVD